MLLRAIKAEVLKCRRAPVWLAFLVLPVFPAVLGTFNYLGNLGVLEDQWYSLWSQHTLFSSMFFLPALFGVFCAWQWRLEHTDHNWNAALTAPVPVGTLYLAKLAVDAAVSLLAMAFIGVLFVLSGKLAGITAPLPPELPRWLLFGGPGGRGGVRRAALFQPGHPGLRPAGGHGPGGGYLGPDGHQPGLGHRLPLLPAGPGHGGQQSPDGAAPALLPGRLRRISGAGRRSVHPLAVSSGRQHRLSTRPCKTSPREIPRGRICLRYSFRSK